jgi:hypothetical protein
MYRLFQKDQREGQETLEAKKFVPVYPIYAFGSQAFQVVLDRTFSPSGIS